MDTIKRKYPGSLFLLGVLQNGIRYFLIGLLGLVLFIIGSMAVPVCKTIGTIVLIGYGLLCVIEQFVIRHVCLKESDHPEFNTMMDDLLGVDENGENTLFHKRIQEMAEETKPQDSDSEN